MTTSIASAKKSPLPAEMSDRFGPMLVKELRQGLRTKIFLTAFIGFQAILLIMVLAGFASQSSGRDSGTFINGTIWTVLSLMLLVITPLRGQFAIEKEIRMGTMELLQITNLDAWRIVRGKWGALMGEAMLYLTAALPYFTLRYFLGGVNILTDLWLLALMALVSSALTAIVIGLSGFRSMLLRIGITLGIIFLVFWSISIVQMMRFSRSMGGGGGGFFSGSFLLHTALVITLIVVGWCYLRLGARTIATQAENHTSNVRLMTFAGLVILLVLDHLNGGGSEDAFAFFMLGLAIYSCGIFSAITDTSLQSSRIYSPFIRRKMTAVGRLLLYPGWGSGFFYVGLMSILMLFGTAMGEEPEIVIISVLCIFNFLMLPAAITRILMRNRGTRIFNLATYITMMVACAIGGVVLQIAEAIITTGTPAITMIFPISAMIGAGSGEEGLAIGLQCLGAFLSAGLLIVVASEDLRFTAKREQATREFLAKRKAEEENKPPIGAELT
ncbi:MAG: hypothetical protein ACI9NC_003632 [Verrucomicrobiales bacterium]|jgi:hypothetical protein